MKLNFENFKNNLDNNFVFEKNPEIAIAVSGGPDSMCLLFLLYEWSKLIKGKLKVIIVNHNIREKFQEEIIFIQNILKKNNIKFKLLTVSKKYVTKKSMNEARNNRYDLLTKYCRRQNILHLFVAHHKNDNLETFFTRKISGSDFDGLQSMRYCSIKNKIAILRPLLIYTKTEIYEYLEKNNIPYILDPTNVNLNYTRPSIRKFLSDTSVDNIQVIENEFKTVLKHYNNYKRMIFEMLNYGIIEISKDHIIYNYSSLKKFNILISEKIIKQIYKFFFHTDKSLRSRKIKILIDELNKNDFTIFNLKGMFVKKSSNSLIFSKKML